jgi:hypothetical protein
VYGIPRITKEVKLWQRKSVKDGDANVMTRLERFSTSAINATDGGALTMATKAKRVLGAEKESSNVRRFTIVPKAI